MLNVHGDSAYQGVRTSRYSTIALSVLTSIFVLSIKFEFVHQCLKQPVDFIGLVLFWAQLCEVSLNQAAVSRNCADPTVVWAAFHSASLLSSRAPSADHVTI